MAEGQTCYDFLRSKQEIATEEVWKRLGDILFETSPQQTEFKTGAGAKALETLRAYATELGVPEGWQCRANHYRLHAFLQGLRDGVSRLKDIRAAGIAAGSVVRFQDGTTGKVLAIHKDFQLKVEGHKRPVTPRGLARA